MKRMRMGPVAVWVMAIGLTCGGSAAAQQGRWAYPPLAVALAPAVQDAQPAPVPPAPPAPPVFVPATPVPGTPVPAPSAPALPMRTPGVPVTPMPPVPWAGMWLDRSAFAYLGTPGAYAGQRGGERRTESVDMPFPDPSKPGALVVHLFAGTIRVKAVNRQDVGIRISHSGRASLLPRKPEPPPAGMRRLTPSSQGALAGDADLQGNQIVLRLMNPIAEADLEIEVPARTNLNLRAVNGGAIEVDGVEGSLEVNNVNGPIRVQGVSGSVVADAVNGDVTVVMTGVAQQKVMAFSSLNGKIDVTLPRTTKANLRVRSDNGDVFTDFDVAQTTAPSRSATAPGFQWTSPNTTAPGVVTRIDRNGRDRRRIDLDGNKTIYGSINGGGPEIDARSFNGAVFIRRGAR